MPYSLYCYHVFFFFFFQRLIYNMNSYFFGSRKREGSANSVKMSFAALPTNQSTSGGRNVRDEHEHAFSFLLQGSSMDVYVDDVG